MDTEIIDKIRRRFNERLEDLTVGQLSFPKRTKQNMKSDA